MEPISMIVAAVVAGAVAAGKDVTAQVVKDGYAGLKGLIQRKFGTNQDVVNAITKVEEQPESKPWQGVLEQELERMCADQDAEVLTAARQLSELLAQHGQTVSTTYNATLSGSGAIAQGLGAMAAGARAVVAGRDIRGNTIVTGDNNVVAQGHVVAREIQGRVSPGSQAPTMGGEKAPVITLLFLAANPSDVTRLRLEEEVRAIDAALWKAALRERFDLHSHWAVRVEELQELLLRYRPGIVHFSGHGSPTGEINLQDDKGRAAAVPVEALSDLFRVLKDNVRCVVLNACFSAPQAEAIARHIDCGVGMAQAIDDKAALQFAVAFYRALADGRSVETAFELGLSQMRLLGMRDADLPRLFGKTDPARVRLVDAGK